jgi:hypothetical protein
MLISSFSSEESQMRDSAEKSARKNAAPHHSLLRREGLSCQGIHLLLILLVAMTTAGAQQDASPTEGVENGNYNYQGSVELGYRFVNSNGSDVVYDTFVNQHQGPRILEQTLNMRSLDHQGLLFDNLFLNSFGWGGDPENATRMRISKNKIYNFNLTFRRDQNFWDYNLLANPLNAPNPFISVPNSPHQMATVRRMYDYNLVLFPQSTVRFRLGYSRNNMEGPAFSSIHQGTDTVLFQNTRTLLDSYHAGIDFRILPRTNISYDQFLQYYRGDSSWNDQNLTFQLGNGTPVDAGIVYNATAAQPCSNTPVPIFNPSTNPPTLKPTCNAYQGYSRFAPTRTSYPTEQLTIQSSYFRRLDLSARGSYSSSDTKVDGFGENSLGLISRNGLRAANGSGTARARRVVANIDLGATFKVTEKLRIVDTFRFSNFRIPGVFDLNQLSFFSGAGPSSILNPIVPYNPAVCPPTCPGHSSGAPADMANLSYQRFLGQDSKYNTIEVEYDFTRHFGGHVGYRYGRRRVQSFLLTNTAELFAPSNPNRGDCVGVPLNPDGTCSFSGEIDSETNDIEVNEHSALFGFWAHPNDRLRITYDMELFSGDNSPTRITPKNLQRYKGRISYKPAGWMNVAGSVNVLESRNNITDIFHREHNRNYGFSIMMNPKPKFGMELGYNYEDIFSTTNICFVTTAKPPANSTICSSGPPYLAAVSLYTNKINFAYGSIMVMPVRRLTLNVGYDLTSTSGLQTILGPTPNTLGPLGMNYHKPFASAELALAKGLSWRTAWNYYDYNEKSIALPLPARDFQSNSATLSLKYAF